MNSEFRAQLNQLYKVNREIEKLNNWRNLLKKEVELFIMKNRMEDKKFLLGDRLISYNQKITTQGITQNYLAKCLSDFFKNDMDMAEELLEYILYNRSKSVKYSLEIKKHKHRTKNR